MKRVHRVQRLVDVLREQEALAFITEHPVDIAYFTGSGDRRGLLVIPQDGSPELVVPAAALEDARQTCESVNAIPVALGVDLAEGFCPSSLGTGRVLLGTVSPRTRARLERMNELLQVCDRPDITLSLQRTKEDAEIDAIRRAVAIAEDGVRAARRALRVGVTELQIAAEATYAIMCEGARQWFSTIVASGPRSCCPDALPSRRSLKGGDMCFVDVGPLFDDYAGDLTRPFVLGEPSSEQESLYRAAKEAQARTLGRVHDGIPARELYAASLEVFRESGLEAYFPHHAGHGLGLLGACPPFLMPNSADTLVAGDVVTVEPGVYVAGVGGCRIEDVVLVTREGYEPISSLDDPWKVAQ